MKFVGIDFSGSRHQWNPNAKTSNVWIAVAEDDGESVAVTSLQPVQQLPGSGRPFVRLANWLKHTDFSAAAIDAPFSLPWWFFAKTFVDHPELLTHVDNLPLDPQHDFPTGDAFVRAVSGEIPFPFNKPLRMTESYWQGRGVSTRSAVWARARPGAPFASACLKLLAATERPCWPWSTSDNTPLLEAFPAAQLRNWGLPCTLYNGDGGHANRTLIIEALRSRHGLHLTDIDLAIIRENADALDAILCCYAARAVARDKLAVSPPPFDILRLEGWIAAHE